MNLLTFRFFAWLWNENAPPSFGHLQAALSRVAGARRRQPLQKIGDKFVLPANQHLQALKNLCKLFYV
jgi:hypothetical protein